MLPLIILGTAITIFTTGCYWFRNHGINKILFPGSSTKYQIGQDNNSIYTLTDHSRRNPLVYFKRELYHRNGEEGGKEIGNLNTSLAIATGPDLIIVYLHANAENVGDCNSLISALSEEIKTIALARQRRVVFVCPEYPGYSPLDDQSGALSIASIERAVNTIVDHHLGMPLSLSSSSSSSSSLIRKKRQPEIIIVGRSIGTGFATKLMNHLMIERANLRGVVLVSPFQSIRHIASERFNSLLTTSAVTYDTLNNEEELKEYLRQVGKRRRSQKQQQQVAMMFIHGRDDELISANQSRKLFGLTKESEGVGRIDSSMRIIHGGHNNIDWIQHTARFIQKLM